ncbi:unnamed protein product [Cuscuta campestris]|uniref:Elongator complex protein 1 n=1 Tax=Cuscuta campestris TaxID=132261 RepID=A0A484KD01_9ASTE|nr:unnamed protein product [Cuscuta campestris]
MNNLKLWKSLSSKVRLQSEDEVLRLAAFDMERNRLFCASSTDILYTTQLPLQDTGVFNSSSYHHLDIEPGDSITCMEYLMEKESLIAGTSHGLIFLYNVDDNLTEIVGRVEGGVKCVSPSPDGDLLGIITGFGQLLVMTQDWEVLYEMGIDNLHDDTDIHEQNISLNDSFESIISWRGDGKYFATLSRVNDSSCLHKKLTVWERESGKQHSVSESNDFMGAAFDWMPSGPKIAAVCYRKKYPSIVFFERNCLERNSFSLNEEIDVTVENLKWNLSSDLLAAIVRSEKYDSLKVWCFSNNHWYLKQEIRYEKEDDVKFMWDPTIPLQLICWTVGGQISTYSFNWVTAVMENSVALIVDGCKILVTPLSLSLIPPPMYLFSLKFPSTVQNLAFSTKGSQNHLATSLSDGSLCILELSELGTWEDLEDKEFDVERASADTLSSSHAHMAWLDSHRLLCVSHLCTDGLTAYHLQEIEFICSENHIPGSVTSSGWQGMVSNHISLEGIVIGVVSDTLNSSAYLQFDGGKVVEYNSKSAGARGILRRSDLSFQSSCPCMNLAHIRGLLSHKSLLFGLDNIGQLHVGENILCNNCTSFSFYSSSADQTVTHLVLATKQDLLYIVDINDTQRKGVAAEYENFLPITSNRKRVDPKIYINIWERGATIAGVLHGDESAIILQTNRGNVECIYPRKLVLTSIMHALLQKRFNDALLMVRRHRIDFNFIVDACGWKSFLESAGEFVKQVNNLSYITEFICSIKNESIIDTIYKSYLSVPSLTGAQSFESEDVIDFSGKNKVSSVLFAIRMALEENVAESPARELCILTTLARSDPPALEDALERIRVLRELELSHSDDCRGANYPSAEEAMKHLLWLSDSEVVFESALGLYDLNLAAMVALNSQKDPKEFLPYLQQLESLETVLMQYTIDLKLHRYEKALKHIVLAGDAYFEDCLNLIKDKPHLFPLGLQLITDSSKRGQVLEAWGDHLNDKKNFEEAATTYLSCYCMDKALKAYRACGNWGGVFMVAGLMKIGNEEILQLAQDLYEELLALGKPGDAAKIALEYCGDVNAGVTSFVSAREWEEALRIALLHRRDDLVLEVKNSSVDCANSLIGEYGDGLEKVGKYLTRYLAVRQRRLLLAAKLKSDGTSVNECDYETSSEASSNFSGMSAYTLGTRNGASTTNSSTSAKKGRGLRSQRNHGKICAGSPGEELALVEHLKGMALASGARRELHSLLICLVMLHEDAVAKKLQLIAKKFQRSQTAAVRLAEDAMPSDRLDEQAHTLEKYVQRVRDEMQHSDIFSWQVKALD